MCSVASDIGLFDLASPPSAAELSELADVATDEISGAAARASEAAVAVDPDFDPNGPLDLEAASAQFERMDPEALPRLRELVGAECE